MTGGVAYLYDPTVDDDMVAGRLKLSNVKPRRVQNGSPAADTIKRLLREHHEATASMDAEAYMRYKIRHAAPFGEGSDLFSSHESADLASNLAHMARAHGFFVPWIEYCVDVPGLIKYLQEKVYVANMDLVKEKPFHSVEAVQAHMRDKSLCRFELEGNEDEYEAFYDLDALAAGSPLWDVVEEEVDQALGVRAFEQREGHVRRLHPQGVNGDG